MPTRRAGGRYYPKLQMAVPFPPATGRRLPDAPRLGRETGEWAAAAACRARCNWADEKPGLSSAHVTFCTEEEGPRRRADGS